MASLQATTINGNATITGTLSESGYIAYPLRQYTIDLSAQSSSNFYPIAIDTPPGIDGTWGHSFSIDFINQSGAAAYNMDCIFGEARGQGWTDQVPYYRIFHNFYDNAERSLLGLWRGTQTFYGVVVYVRGGKNYYVRTTSRSVVGYTSAATIGNAVFAIKNSSNTDVSGTSANIAEMLNLINNPSGFYYSDNAYIGTNQVLHLGTTSAPSLNIGGNAANVTGTVAIANGGSGQTSAQAAMNAFAGAVTGGSYLRGNGTNVVMSAIQAADVPTLNQNTTGNAGSVTNGVYTTGNQSIAGNKTFTGITTFDNASDNQIVLNGGGTTWAGIGWTDVNGTDYIWFNGQNKTFAIGGGGSNISGKKLHVDGAVTIGADYDATAVISNSLNLQGPLQVGNYKTYIFNDLSAAATQARTYEIARIGIDYNDWNSIGTLEVEIHEKYWSRGLKKVYHIWYGYVSNSGIRLVEYRGAGDNNFQCRISGETTVAGDQRYISVFVDVRNYVYVDVVVKSNRNYTTNTNPEIGYTYINLAPTPTNIADFTADSDLEISTLTTAKLGGNTILTSATTSAPNLSIGGNAANVTGVVAIANGGTGATTAAQARTNLGITTSSGTVTSVSGTGTVSGLTLTGTVTTTGNLTLGGTLSVAASNFASQTANTFLAAPNGAAGTPTFRAIVAADVPTLNQNTTGTAANVTGTVAVANGGTGTTTAQLAINALAGAVTSGQYLRGNGTNVVMSAIQAADVPTLNQNTTGSSGSCTGNAATATNVAWSGITSKPTTLSGFGITDAMYQYDPNGFVQGDINGSGNMQRLWGPDSVQNLLAFRPPTTIEYTTDNVNWTATTISNDVFDNKLFGKWSGFNIGAGANVGNWTKVRLTWVNFGYHFFSHFNMCHSTNGHSMNFVFYKSDLNGVFSSEAFRVNGINSWPGYTFAAHNNVSGWWDTRDVRMVFEVVRNNDYPNNYITVGSIQLMGGYSSFTRLYDWDGNRNITMAGTVTAAGFTGPGTGLTGTAASLSIGGNAATASSVAATNITGTVAISSGGTGAATTTANAFFVGPNGSAGAPSFRAMATSDIPASIVTFAKLQDIAGPALVGRLSATSGPVAALGSANARTAIGATTVGSNLITLADPGAIRFIRINADNTISALSDVDFRTAIGAGTGGGGVTSVTGTAPIASSGGATPAISLNDAGVTYAKIQNVSVTSRVLGRITAGAGVIEELTGANIAQIIGSNTITNATNATNATNVTVTSGDTTANWFPVVWHTGSTLKSSTGVQIYASGGYVQANYFNSSDDENTGNISHIIAKFGDGYHRSATAAKVAAFITGQSMNIAGTATNVTGTVAVANGGTGATSFTAGRVLLGNGTTDITTSANLSYNTGTNRLGVGTTTPGYTLDVGGACHASSFPTSSDVRFKKNIQPLTNALQTILSLRGVKYEWNNFIHSERPGYELNTPVIGMIAQEVENVIPEIVGKWVLNENFQDARSLEYQRIIPYLIEAVKELENKNKLLEARILALENK